jgi:hypothetical protein
MAGKLKRTSQRSLNVAKKKTTPAPEPAFDLVALGPEIEEELRAAIDQGEGGDLSREPRALSPALAGVLLTHLPSFLSLVGRVLARRRKG